jgi:RND family efflux transporter MFP subunit
MNQITTPPGPDGAEPKQSAMAGTEVAAVGGATRAGGGRVAADAVPTRREAAPGHGPGALAPDEPERARVDPALDRRRGRLALMLGVAAVLLVGALVALGAWSHSRTSASAAQALQQQNDAVPQVRVAAVKVLDGPRRIELPGNMQAFDAATLYARSTGYVAKRNVDIGSRVHAGDVLAVIASPDVDQQYAQAQLAQTAAAYAQASANQKLAGITSQRTADLVQHGWSSRQQGDTDKSSLEASNAGVGVAKANIEAQAAEVRRLKQLVEFERITAPFDGVITTRDVDVGSLVVANSQSGTQLFSIARSDVLRVQVYVPQEDYFSLHDGEDAMVSVPELPGREFHGKVARNAGTLQAGTRTLLTEVDVDNRDGALAAGLYGIVHLDVPRVAPVALVPSEAVIFSKDGLNAAVFDNGVLRLHKLDVLADDGAQVEVQAGLKAGEQLILNPPVLASEGMKVAVAAPDGK